LRLQTRGLLAPARTPEGVIGKLNAVVNARLRAANMQAALVKLGLDARMLSPQEFGAVLADEMRLWQAVVQATGVKLE
jgi:tripartite-type tricarboxylate transporter receptor subunit TctC